MLGLLSLTIVEFNNFWVNCWAKICWELLCDYSFKQNILFSVPKLNGTIGWAKYEHWFAGFGLNESMRVDRENSRKTQLINNSFQKILEFNSRLEMFRHYNSTLTKSSRLAFHKCYTFPEINIYFVNNFLTILTLS